MKSSLLLGLSAFLLVMIGGCGESSPFNPTYKTGYIGRSGEILVVADTDLWEGSLGDSLKEIFHRPVPYLTNREDMFGLIQIEQKVFDKDYQKYRNILEIEVGDREDLRSPKLTMQKNKYAVGQLYMHAGAKSLAEVKKLIVDRAEAMVDRVNEAEIERTISYFDTYGAPSIEEAVEEEFGVKMFMPVQAKLVDRKPSFVHALRNMGRRADGDFHDVRQGVIVYSFPYTSDSTFTQDYLIQKRDSVLKIHFKGEQSGSYVATETRFPPITREININDNYGVEMRGLWITKNGFDGGPFVSVAQLDSTGHNVIVSEGYVFAPRFRNDEYLREVEACAKSLKTKSQS